MEDHDFDSWQPPSAAEMKVIQARRERSDRISKIMGQYLLKGYKMLASNCETCGTIFLQDKHGALYCVACAEVDPEIQKDSPALNQEAAERQLQEARYLTSTETTPARELPSTSNGGLTTGFDVSSIPGSEPAAAVPFQRSVEEVATSTVQPPQVSLAPGSSSGKGVDDISLVVSSCVRDTLDCLDRCRVELLAADSLNRRRSCFV